MLANLQRMRLLIRTHVSNCTRACKQHAKMRLFLNMPEELHVPHQMWQHKISYPIQPNEGEFLPCRCEQTRLRSPSLAVFVCIFATKNTHLMIAKIAAMFSPRAPI